MMPKSDLPFGGEFSPQQVKLRRLLELAHDNRGSRAAFQAEVRQEYFESHATTDDNKQKLAGNCWLAMIAYQIINRAASLDTLGQKLFALREDEDGLHREFARHILLNLNGMSFVQCIQDMQGWGNGRFS